MKKQSAFTLAEIMIVLAVIGVLTAILLPVAISSAPNEDVMKFKKGHATLFKIIREITNSGEYFTPGDLSYYPDGRDLDNPSYLCMSMSELVSTKEVNCKTGKPASTEYVAPWAMGDTAEKPGDTKLVEKNCDVHCVGVEEDDNIQDYFITADNITYYDHNADAHFATLDHTLAGVKMFKRTSHFNGLEAYMIYKCICMDVDGINKGLPPFGYGLRVDGKIVIGERAQEWLKKDIQEKD